ncbi:MAG: peptidoglycan DD-metalloendopeptidase family protein [Acidiferrobacterales bacterium]|nr:peptidoglycan DD-metalloendopeptidase family protein [Acidiferrobacterales bacterium]
MKKISVFVLLFLFAASAGAIELPESNSVPGGVVVVPLYLDGQAMPRAEFQNRQVMVIRDGSRWLAIAGIPLKLKPGEYKLTTIADGKKNNYPIKIVDKKYPVQRLTIKNKRKVYPNKNDLKRITAEREKIGKAFVVWSYNPEPPLKFDLPTQGRFSSQFGLQRFYNDSPRPRRHSALDIAAPTGTPVYAPAAGTVINIGDYYFTGNTIFLDHGQGLITQYIHLSKVDVPMGMRVERGQKIGEVGATGRVTGPHLHWGVILNQTMIDPMPFIRADSLERNQAYLDSISNNADQKVGGS